MLKITVAAIELYDEVKEEFISSFTTSKEPQTLQLEHSLVSLSKWESKWRKPFLSKEDKTFEESVDYIRCMTITQNVNEDVYNSITPKIITEVSEYIDSPMTATTFAKEEKKVTNRQIVTSEVIYSWMVAQNIPFECQKWHLNRLLTLINVCNIMNTPQKKLSKKEIINRNRSLNEKRKAELNTNG